MWPSTIKYHSLETETDKKNDESVGEYQEQTPLLGILLREDTSAANDELRKELLKLNRLFKLMESVERRFKTKIVQITDDFDQ